MKVIVSHDVDHLFSKEHWFRDLFYPKLWVRTTIHFFAKRITIREWWLRCVSCFRRRINNIDSLLNFDTYHGVPSSFFFGMRQGLGMSYKTNEARPVIQHVHDMGFSTGVHGIDYINQTGINSEHSAFKSLMGFLPCGIRMHYVRFDEGTFDKLNCAGYKFDSTEFDKAKGYLIKSPYKVGEMWEFPLTIMDVYLPQKLELAKEKTMCILEQCKKSGLQYVSILFHDFQFCDDYNEMKDWYTWLIKYIKASDEYVFISYEDAIKELENSIN